MEFPKFKYRPIASEGVDAVLVNSADDEAALVGDHFDTPDQAREAFAAAQAAATTKATTATTKAGR